MEGCLALFAIAFAFAPLVMAIVSMARQAALRRELEAMQRTLWEVQSDLRQLRRSQGSEAPAGRPAPRPEEAASRATGFSPSQSPATPSQGPADHAAPPVEPTLESSVPFASSGATGFSPSQSPATSSTVSMDQAAPPAEPTRDTTAPLAAFDAGAAQRPSDELVSAAAATSVEKDGGLKPLPPPSEDSGDDEPAPQQPYDPPASPPPPPPQPPAASPQLPSFDWEKLIGVRLFSWIAAVAAVLGVIFFLKYSVDHGWIGPSVRAALGLATGTLLLVLCEMRVARDYETTANAMHGAGIAILYATLFAIHALWHLAPAPVVFLLMIVVTGVAVALSIRRDSVFIALLGLVGGFATPALISTGENRPIGLFSYLLMLNVGLAWIAHRKRWPVLTAVSLVFTVLYQWAWIGKYLTASQLPLAVGIFIVFALAGSVTLWLRRTGDEESDAEKRFGNIAVASSVLPLAFALFAATVPAYGARFHTLFTFLFLIGAGLLAIARFRGPAWLGGAAALTTLLTWAIWSATSYRQAQPWPGVLAWLAAFVLLFVGATWGRRQRLLLTSGSLFFMFPVLAAIEPETTSPALLFGTLFVLLAVVAWSAIRHEAGMNWFVASLFAILTEAIWSARNLQEQRLLGGLVVYAGFGILFVAVPLVARRAGRPLRPEGGVAVTVILSLAVTIFLTFDGVAPSALWGLALLLGFLLVAAIREARDTRRPALAGIAVLLAWIVLALWWEAAPLEAALIPALAVIAIFGIIGVVALGWAGRTEEGFRSATHLGLSGYLFLFFVAAVPALSIPPWPMLATVTVLTLTHAVGALAIRRISLLTSSAIAAQMVLIVWTRAADNRPWTETAIAAAVIVAWFAIGWASMLYKRGACEAEDSTATAFAASFSGVFVLIFAGQQAQHAVTGALLAGHLILIGSILAIAWITSQHSAAVIAAIVTAVAVAAAPDARPVTDLVFAGALSAPFVLYPLLLGRRAGSATAPYLSAIIAAASFFFFGREAMKAGGWGGIIGVLPVGLAAVMIVLLIRLTRLEPPGERALGRLALVAAAALAFITVAIPLQLDKEWITIGWALEGAALVWLYRRIPHRGLLRWSAALLAIVVVRLVFNPAVFHYHPRSEQAILNWYLYTYGLCAAALFVAAWLMPRTERLFLRACAAAGTVLLFFLLNIEIADFYSKGPALTFNFLSSSLAQDLTYTIGWATFALMMLVTGLVLASRAPRIAAIVLLLVTVLKCFLHDLGRLGGLYRVASLLGLAMSLVAVGLLLQKFVLKKEAGGVTADPVPPVEGAA